MVFLDCPECRLEEDDLFKKIRDYIWEHPNVTAGVLIQEFGVSLRQVNQWIREERLTYLKAENTGLYCKNCGVALGSGMYCYECKAGITDGFKTETNKKNIKGFSGNKVRDDKMRYL